MTHLKLTKAILSQQVLGGSGWFARTGLVDGLHTELVRLAFNQVGHASFAFVTGNLKVEIEVASYNFSTNLMTRVFYHSSEAFNHWFQI